MLVAVSVLGWINLLTAAEGSIAPGNVISITVLGYPELSKSATVRQDGTTDYPLLYNIPIDGMTVQDLREFLMPILTRYVERPHLFVNISEFLQLQVTIQGQVVRPGNYTVQGPIDIQGLLASAGGPTTQADLSRISILRRAGDHQREIAVNLFAFLRGKTTEPLPLIENGDIIFVPTLVNESMVRVMGAITDPGAYMPLKDENVADMIYMAGGPTARGNLNDVTLVRYQDGKYSSEALKIKSLIERGRTDLIPAVHSGDVIFVKEFNEWKQVSFWVAILRDATLILSSIVVLYRI
jgi:protein involved in polysaccharide export with SLBB domain